MQSTVAEQPGQDKADKLRLVTDLFRRLHAHVESVPGCVCIDHLVEKRLIFTEDTCAQWLDGKRQLFGSFFDVGAGDYLLHVLVGTTNLHIGVVRARRDEGRVEILRMGEFDYARFESRLNPRLPAGRQLARRGWGHVWCSIDCGDLTAIGAEILDLKDGPLAAVLSGMLASLPAVGRERAWAWLAFDRRQWFRFFVDGRFQKKYAGWRGYEANEAGSVQGMLNAFAFAIETLERAADFDVPYILEMHRRCMDRVRSNNPKSTPGQPRFLEAGFHFYAKNSTLASLAEIFEMRRGDGTAIFHDSGYGRPAGRMDYLEAYEAIQKHGKLRFRPWYPNLTKAEKQLVESRDGSPRFQRLKDSIQRQFLEKMKGCIDRYHAAVAAAGTDMDIIHAVARVARDLELLHPFPDGNGRAFPVVLASQLLLFHGFPPPIFHDPNIDAELSYAEFAANMVAAMRDTVGLLKSPDKTLHDYTITAAGQEEIDRFATMARELGGRLDLLDRSRRPDEAFVTADYAAWVTEGRWVSYRPGLRFTGVGSHRTYRPGCLYFGLAVEDWKKEGKSVAEELRRVIAKGAAALVLDEAIAAEADACSVPVLVVADLNRALKALAHRTRKDVGCATVLVTGTEGKTGAKLQLHHLLSRQTETHAVLNSANTEGPVLFSLANLKATTRVEINEVSVGADEKLRVERTRLVSPDLCLITNIGPNHMHMHKTIENVITAKSSVVEGLPTGGTAILNGDNEYFEPLVEAIRRRRPDVAIATYGSDPAAEARLVSAEFEDDRLGWTVRAEIAGRSLEYFLPLLQNYAPLASLGVLLTVHRLGHDVAKAAADYADFQPFETMGRVLKLHLGGGDAVFYDQSRRGGMHGMRSAFQDLAHLPVTGKVVALVGGISVKQDGDWTRQSHGELAQLINASRIDRLYTTGSYMDYVAAGLRQPDILVRHSDDIEELAALLQAEMQPGDLLFIIGSAYLYLGRVSDILLKHLPHSLLQTSEPTP